MKIYKSDVSMIDFDKIKCLADGIVIGSWDEDDARLDQEDDYIDSACAILIKQNSCGSWDVFDALDPFDFSGIARVEIPFDKSELFKTKRGWRRKDPSINDAALLSAMHDLLISAGFPSEYIPSSFDKDIIWRNK